MGFNGVDDLISTAITDERADVAGRKRQLLIMSFRIDSFF
jgi:hypothetical protein